MLKTKNYPILIVDDLKENLIGLRKLLVQDGHEVVEALSGEEALSKCLSAEFDLFILDVQMPGMDGFELAEHLKGTSKTKDVPIIFVTAISREDHHIRKGYETGAIDYMFKPLNSKLLKLKVQSFLQVRRQQKELEALMIELEEKNKELTQFSYMVSHDLKNPLWGIGGLLDCINEELHDTSDETQEYLELAKEKVHHMENLISGLLSYSKAGTEKLAPEKINLTGLAEEVLRNTHIPENFVITVQPTLPEVVGYKILLQQVFANLLSNAIKHNDKEQGEVSVSSKTENDIHIIKISDNGPGVPDNLKERIFDIFQTGVIKMSPDNSGIGLSIVRKLVNLHGGETWVENGVNGGSVFCYSLPI